MGIEICDWCGKGIKDENEFKIWLPRWLDKIIIKNLNLKYITSLHFCSEPCLITFLKNKGQDRKLPDKNRIIMNNDKDNKINKIWDKDKLKKAMREAKRKDRLWRKEEKEIAINAKNRNKRMG